jgi:hypothetical protein
MTPNTPPNQPDRAREREADIARIMARDGISREEAEEILRNADAEAERSRDA